MNGPMLENVVKSVLLKPGCVFLRFWSIFMAHSALEKNTLTYLACADKITVSFNVQHSTTECGPKIQKKAAAAAAKLELWEKFQMYSTELRGDESTENLNEL